MSKQKKEHPFPPDSDLRKLRDSQIENRLNKISKQSERKKEVVLERANLIKNQLNYNTFLITENVTEENKEQLKTLLAELEEKDVATLVKLINKKKMDTPLHPRLQANSTFIQMISGDKYFILMSELYLFFIKNIDQARELHLAILESKAEKDQKLRYKKHWQELLLLLSVLLNHSQMERDWSQNSNPESGKAETLKSTRKQTAIMQRTLMTLIESLESNFSKNPIFQEVALKANSILGIENYPILNLAPLVENLSLYLTCIMDLLTEKNKIGAPKKNPLEITSLSILHRIYWNITQSKLIFTIENDLLKTSGSSKSLELNKMLCQFYKQEWCPIKLSDSAFKYFKSVKNTILR